MATQAVFLVGGRGTRLGVLSETTPKPLLTVGGRPFLDYLIAHALDQGIDRFILLGGHLGNQVDEYASSWRVRGIDMQSIVEPEPAGTGGALHFARERLDDRFFLCNGDSYFDINLRDLEEIGAGQQPIACLALRSVDDAGRYGRVTCAGERIIGFSEKSADGPGIINGGNYLLSHAVFDYLPTGPSSLEQDVFPALVQANRIFGRAYAARFIDIGIPDDLTRSRNFFSPNDLASYCYS